MCSQIRGSVHVLHHVRVESEIFDGVLHCQRLDHNQFPAPRAFSAVLPMLSIETLETFLAPSRGPQHLHRLSDGRYSLLMMDLTNIL